MQMKDAAQLRKNWAAKGNPPCKHSHLDKEYIEGFDTGDHVCVKCGKSFTDEEYEKL